MLVAVLAERGAAGHDQERLAELERGEDRPHAGVRDDRVGGDHAGAALRGRDEAAVLDMPRRELAGPTWAKTSRSGSLPAQSSSAAIMRSNGSCVPTVAKIKDVAR